MSEPIVITKFSIEANGLNEEDINRIVNALNQLCDEDNLIAYEPSSDGNHVTVETFEV